MLITLSILMIALAVVPASSQGQASPPTAPVPPTLMTELLRYEPTGLSLLSPYTRGKIPVIFVHGLWSTPSSWNRMVEALEHDPALEKRYQFWTFGYSTGDPLLYSSDLLRKSLKDVRHMKDPDQSDKAFEEMVLIGHSMGGLLSKTMVSNSGDQIWRVISDQSFEEMRGAKKDRDLFRQILFFEALAEVRRVVFIATPHGGSHIDRGAIERLGSRLVRIPDPLRDAHDRLMATNEPTFFRISVRKSVPTSIEELDVQSPFLMGLATLPTAATVKVHSIIAVRSHSLRGERTDGLVAYDSAHLTGASSEKVVETSHLCQDHPHVIDEVRRILTEAN